MGNTALHDRVRQLLEDGQLPKGPATKVVAGYGDDSPCALCNRPMRATEVVYQLVHGPAHHARSHAMHYACFASWERASIAESETK